MSIFVLGTTFSLHRVVGIRSSFRRHLLTNPGMNASPESHRATQFNVSTVSRLISLGFLMCRALRISPSALSEAVCTSTTPSPCRITARNRHLSSGNGVYPSAGHIPSDLPHSGPNASTAPIRTLAVSYLCKALCSTHPSTRPPTVV